MILYYQIVNRQAALASGQICHSNNGFNCLSSEEMGIYFNDKFLQS